MKRFATPFVLAFLSLSCNEDEPDADEARAAASAAVAEALSSAAPAPAASAEPGVPDPCEVLTEAMVRKHLSVPEDVKIDQRPSKHSPHPLCGYSWDTATEEEKKAQNAEMVKKMMAGMKKGKLAQGVLEAAGSTSEEAHLTILKQRFESEASAKSRLDGVKRMMERGIKSEVKGQEVEFQSKMEPVEGIGSAAFWSPKQSQLSLTAKRYLIHVGVRAKDASKNLGIAKALAKDVIENL